MLVYTLVEVLVVWTGVVVVEVVWTGVVVVEVVGAETVTEIEPDVCAPVPESVKVAWAW